MCVCVCVGWVYIYIIDKSITLVDAQSHSFSEIGQVSPAFRHPQIVNFVWGMEVKVKLELESFFKKSVVAMFFRFIKN